MAYKLLTPGPLTTSIEVKEAMLKDSCTWDSEYKEKVEKIRASLLDIASVGDDYTCVLMQGSGTFSIESTINTLIGKQDKLLSLSNGAYGHRIYEIAKKNNKNVVLYESDETDVYDISNLKDFIIKQNDLTHISLVHCETTTGIINNIEEICELANEYNLKIILDAMSSFGGIEINCYKNNIIALVSSSNKCLEGVPGFGFNIIKKTELEKCKDNACSISLDLYEQWLTFEADRGKWRFTSPTHVVLAFEKALELFYFEGGIHARNTRYVNNQKTLVKKMRELGFSECIKPQNQSPIITTFYYYDNPNFDFEKFYDYLKRYGFIIYPGKLSKLNVFRIGNIGQIFEEDILNLCMIIKKYIQEELK